ncbi:expressed unknown protein [Seminavis robusta]|uniref:Uncharacterized protein n=1 Tax=Seminavis robusta TaxID=568900 RepID=A0A9N8HNX6_9STRA|nr:expressed unknown protein [Seminavis robusta]|eukprot:Sro1033_g233720.1 n/a (319) ;mRNA; f:24041-25446
MMVVASSRAADTALRKQHLKMVSPTTLRRSGAVWACFLVFLGSCDAFSPLLPSSSPTRTFPQQSISETQTHLFMSSSSPTTSRRNWGKNALAWLTSGAVLLPSAAAVAEDAVAAPPLDMKLFVDPKGLFAVNVPSKFFKLRRTESGDLPDEKTGKGRRGSSIFTAGDLGKAEIIAVERFPTKVLLEENGIEPTGDLSTFPAIGESLAVANLINLRREKEKTGNTMIDPESVSLSEDKMEIRFRMRTEIDVQKPELLMETYGVRQLFRLTTAKATLNSNDGNIMAVFASALEQDFNGRDRDALEEAVDSFTATDQSTKK